MKAMLLAAAVVSAIAGTATAQTRSGVLNTLHVQRLVATDTPASHAALSRHFIALADVYAAKAARYNGMASVASGNPNRTAPVTTSARRVRQAEEMTTLWHAARAMAAYHQLLSVGASPTAPAHRSALDGGFGARVPTAAELAEFAASARTTADHRALEEYFRLVADRSALDAQDHAAMANGFRASGQRRGSELAAMHCDRLGKLSRAAAKDASAAAAHHRQLASIG
jgi:hypothetical protein